jgi:hypothetical protein
MSFLKNEYFTVILLMCYTYIHRIRYIWVTVYVHSYVAKCIYSHPPRTLQSSNELFNRTLDSKWWLSRCFPVITTTPSMDKWISPGEVGHAEEMKCNKSCQLPGVSSHQIYATQQMILSKETIRFVNFCRVEGISVQSKTTERRVTDLTYPDKQEQRWFLK